MSQYTARWPDGFTVVWRNLTWAEYRRFRDRFANSVFDEPMSVALEIYATVKVSGPDPKFVPAGIPSYICKQQMQHNPYSGNFKDINKALTMARDVVGRNYLLTAKGLIANALNYKPEEIDNWDPNIFFIRLAQAEAATGRNFEPVDPSATSKPEAPEQSTKKPLTASQQKALKRTKDAGRASGESTVEVNNWHR